MGKAVSALPVGTMGCGANFKKALDKGASYRIFTIKEVGSVVEKEFSLQRDRKRLAGMLKALGNPIRFGIVEFLAKEKTCITADIVEATPLAQSTVSQHLKVLREAGLIRGEIEGPVTCYCLDRNNLRWLKEQIGLWLSDCC